MKRLAIVMMAVLIASSGMAQQVKVKVKPKPKVDVKVNPDVRVDVNPDVRVDVDPDLNIDVNTDIRVNPDVIVNAIQHVDLDKHLSEALDGAFSSLGDHGDHSADYQTNEQEIEIPLSNPGERGKLDIESHNGRIKITAYEGNTVKVKMVKYGKKVDKEKTKDGMRLVSTGGFNVQAQEYRNVVKVENEGWGNRMDFEVQVPKNFDIKAESYNNGHIFIEGVEGELNVESYNGPITLVDINGSASASTYNGAVKVSFTGVTADTNMAFSTYNGDVDLTLPGNAKITTKMKTNRDIYTDFEDFDLSQEVPSTNDRGRNGGDRGRSGGYRIKFENWVRGKVNGGGPEVMMKTTNGNIYIRKNN